MPSSSHHTLLFLTQLVDEPYSSYNIEKVFLRVFPETELLELINKLTHLTAITRAHIKGRRMYEKKLNIKRGLTPPK